MPHWRIIHYQKRVVFSRHTVFTNVQVRIHHRRQHILEVEFLVYYVFLKLKRSIEPYTVLQLYIFIVSSFITTYM